MRAATPADFFQRYPSLFPFVLSGKYFYRFHYWWYCCVNSVVFICRIVRYCSCESGDGQQRLACQHFCCCIYTPASRTNPSFSLSPTLDAVEDEVYFVQRNFTGLRTIVHRTSTLESSPPDASNARKDSGGAGDILESTFTDVQCDISLFIPLIQMCSSQQLYHVCIIIQCYKRYLIFATIGTDDGSESTFISCAFTAGIFWMLLIIM